MNTETDITEETESNRGRELVMGINFRGTYYEAGTVPPDHIADQMTNPLLFGDPIPDHQPGAGLARGHVTRRKKPAASAPKPGAFDTKPDWDTMTTAKEIAKNLRLRGTADDAAYVMELEMDGRDKPRAVVAEAVAELLA